MMMKEALPERKDIRFDPRDSLIKEDIIWITKYDPDKALFRGKYYYFFKRIFDVLMIMVSLPVLIPLVLLVMFLMKHECPDRKIFFKQLRTGRGGNRFWMYKFQTMVPNADELKPALMHLNVLEWPDFKVPDDPRVTKLGKVLRRTSIDEIPQLWNVLKGEMSLVGPRPTSFARDTYKIWQTERLDVPPGMTGLWQITHRGETEFNERLLLDIAYIQHSCLALDIEIIVRTFLSIFKGRGVT
jgi:lipopolysaccharide/colanic/teichoic acid biosynthesis glycosyltransferase